MTLVVADTGPIRYLILIGAIDVIAKLSDRVILPNAVLSELNHPKAPPMVKQWAANLPGWIEIRTPHFVELAGLLDPGEAEAIALATELDASLILLDEAEGRKEALRRGLPVAGTIGLLEKAAQGDFLDLRLALQKLSRTNFRIDPELIQSALQRDAARRSKKGPPHG